MKESKVKFVLRGVACALAMQGLAACSTEITTLARKASGTSAAGGAPAAVTSLAIMETSPTRSWPLTLDWGIVVGSYDQYCILENMTNYGSCVWLSGALPTSYSDSAADGALVLSAYLKNSYGISERIDSNTVTIDHTVPTLASVAVTNSDPTASSTFSLSFGATGGGTYSHYCINENSSSVAACVWNAGALPASRVVTSGDGSITLTVWLRDDAGNVSTPRASSAIVLDTAAPTVAISLPAAGTYANAANAAAFPVSGTCSENGRNVVITGDASATVVCAAGAWSTNLDFSAAAPGTVSISIDHEDAAGNDATAATRSFVKDAVAPTVAISSPAASSFIGSATVAAHPVSGTCSENGRNVVITGDASATVVCAAGAWSTNLDFTAAASGTVSISVAHDDAAGNVATAATRSFVKDVTAPTLLLTSFTGGGVAAGGVAANITWTSSELNPATSPISLAYSTNSGGAWTNIALSEADDGTHSWSVPSLDIATARVRVILVDAAGNSTTATSGTNFAIDTSAPVFTVGMMEINDGVSPTINNYVRVEFTAVDSASTVDAYCLKYNLSTAPAANDSCWVSVSPAASYAADVNFRLAVAAGVYTVYAWAKDAVGHISSLTSAGAGTAGRDRAAITFDPAPPPVTTGVIASASDVATNLSVPSGSTIYIKWDASSADGLLVANPISIFYTYDDLNYTPIVSGLANSAGAGCTISGAQTGCYTWTNGSPSNSYYRVRVGAVDSNSRLSFSSSPPINTTTTLRVLAGATDPGTDGSAESALFVPRSFAETNGDPQAFLVSTSGVVYFADTIRGILKVNPLTGIQEILVRDTGAIADGSANSGGVPGTATVQDVTRMAFDPQGRVVFIDSNRIRRLDPVAGTVASIVGGGGTTTTPVAAGSLNIALNSSNNQILYVAADGKIYFQSRHYANTANLTSGFDLKVFDPGTGLVNAITFSGTGVSFDAAQDISFCRGGGIGPTFDPVTGVRGKTVLFLYRGAAGCPGSSTDGLSVTDASTNQAIAPHPSPLNYDERFLVGGNGRLYSFSRVSNRARAFDAVTQTWTNILGTGTNGTCSDSTAATSCAIDISSLYVDANGQIYYLERGKIRSLDQSSNVYTVMGSGFHAGDGAQAIYSRIGAPNDVKAWNDGSVDRVVFADNSQFRYREFAVDGLIQTIAGNGSDGDPSTTGAAASQPISYNSCGMIDRLYLDLDPVNGNVFTTRGRRLAKLDRSTGQWVDIFGSGGTGYWAADGLLGNQISADCYSPKVLAYDGTNVLVQRFRYFNNTAYDVFLKLYHKTSGLQTHLAGVTGNGTYLFSADGTAASSVVVPYNELSGAWDAFGSRWIYLDGEQERTKVRMQTTGGAIGTLATLPTNARSISYRHDAGNDFVYYCNADTGQLEKYNVATSSHSTLVWPIGAMKCTGRGMTYSTTRGSIIFPFVQNGAGGIAEYLNP